jgi:hypothetical protein
MCSNNFASESAGRGHARRSALRGSEAGA